MPVLGMGGYFFRSQNPQALKAWYRDHLGVGGGMGTDASGQMILSPKPGHSVTFSEESHDHHQEYHP
jgi:hypothetical protein